MDRLKADGLVTSDKEEIVDGRLRRYYRAFSIRGNCYRHPFG
jgi:DNA-binding PadR family transcriptional regulator